VLPNAGISFQVLSRKIQQALASAAQSMQMHRPTSYWRRRQSQRLALIVAIAFGTWFHCPATCRGQFDAAGSKKIQFEKRPDDSLGYRDYLDYPAVEPIETPSGLITYVGNYEGYVEPGSNSGSINFVRLADDVNENGIPGVIIIIDPVSGRLTTMTDFSDLHTFNVAYNDLAFQSQRGLRSYDVGAVYWLYEEIPERDDGDALSARRAANNIESLNRSIDGAHGTSQAPIVVVAPARAPVVPQFTRFAANRRSGGFGLVYGYRQFVVRDRAGIDASGGIFGRLYTRTDTENSTTGPQVGLVAFQRFGPLSFYAHGLLVASWNEGNVEQSNGFGAQLVPGATNRLLYAQPTNSNFQDPRSGLVPAGVFWAETGLQLTQNSALKFSWSALFLDNIFLSDNRTRYFLPDMGLTDPGNQNLFVHNFFCGIEIIR
jgi:hypothetical protein